MRTINPCVHEALWAQPLRTAPDTTARAPLFQGTRTALRSEDKVGSGPGSHRVGARARLHPGPPTHVWDRVESRCRDELRPARFVTEPRCCRARLRYWRTRADAVFLRQDGLR